jgi:hypothetical protein
MERFFVLLLCILGLFLVACDESPASTQSTTATSVVQATQAPIKTTPTRQAAYPVCNDKATNTPCVTFGTVQDAAYGESSVDSKVYTHISKGVVFVLDDITNVKSTVFGSATTLDAIQLNCFNMQQALWYGLKSTINNDGSLTFRKSTFTEVDITFMSRRKGSAPFAACRLKSAGVDRIDKAGMWEDGDFVGAWSLYDSTYFK